MKYYDKYVLHPDDASVMLLLKHWKFQGEIIERGNGGMQWCNSSQRINLFTVGDALRIHNDEFSLDSIREESVVFP